MSKIIIWLINFYQAYLSFDKGLLMILAPGGACRMDPSCSEYTKKMVLSHGPIRGLWLGGRRIFSCR